MAEPLATIRDMTISIPLLRALVASGDWPVFPPTRETEMVERAVLDLIAVAENAHDYLNLTRPGHMNSQEWDDLRSLHANRLRESLARFGFA